MLSGVDTPYKKGLLGHNDADILLHAISDALLGVAVLGDIGTHFPDSDPTHSGADSAELLHTIGNSTRAAGYEIGSTDSTVICQALKPAPYISAIHARTVEVLAPPMRAVSIKASGEEHMGFAGRGEGIAAHTTCLLAERTK